MTCESCFLTQKKHETKECFTEIETFFWCFGLMIYDIFLSTSLPFSGDPQSCSSPSCDGSWSSPTFPNHIPNHTTRRCQRPQADPTNETFPSLAFPVISGRVPVGMEVTEGLRCRTWVMELNSWKEVAKFISIPIYWVYPPPRMPVTNEGLGWDSLLKM